MSEANLADNAIVGRSPADEPSAAAAAGEGEAEHLEKEVIRLNEELQSAHDRALRAQAELENFRKRIRREMDDERRYCELPLLAELLPVVDNLERAINASDQGQGSGLLEGVKLVCNLLLGVLERHHCRRIQAEDQPFDPNRHQAIGHEPSETRPAGVVTRIACPGYQLHDRVVRPAQVLISSGPPGPQPGPAAAAAPPGRE